MKLSKQQWLYLVIAFCAVIITLGIVLPVALTAARKMKVDMTASQTGGGNQSITVTWDAKKHVDMVEITVKHDGDIVTSQTITDRRILESGSTDVYAYYGNQDVTLKVRSGNKIGTASKSVKVFADEYNIAPITATMPVTIFTLNLDTVTNNSTIPTFVWLKRSDAWDWSQLPEGVYPMPTITEGTDFFDQASQKIAYKKVTKWVKELYEMNKSSKFNFYYNDYFAYGWMDATIGNGIPEENYHVTLLSDGTDTFSRFNTYFNNANYQANYDAMAVKYAKLKQQVAKNGVYTQSSKYIITADELREYTYVSVNEESNLDWWLTRVSGTLAPNSTDAYNALVTPLVTSGKIKVKDLNTSFTALDEAGTERLKKLYNFNDSMFEEAQKQNKKVMMIVGTNPNREGNLEAYVHMMMDYYGDEYLYYYKGHPKFPSNVVEGRKARLDNLNLIELDATIPAELIMFFNPGIYLSGYTSTTFVSAESADKCCFLYEISYASASTSSGPNNYVDKMDACLTQITTETATYGELIPADETGAHFLAEFKGKSYDIGIYSVENRTFTYYKLFEGVYTKVDA